MKLLLDKGWIEPSTSEWAARAFAVPKAESNKWRVVIDYRYLNENCKSDSHPIPVIEDTVSKQTKNKMWSLFDCQDGYHQMHLHPDDRHLTAFVTGNNVYQWRVLPMGFKNSGSAFQRLMNWVLRDVPNVHVYIDDIIVGSEGDTEEELIANHEKDVFRVLEALEKANIVLKESKCPFF